MNEDLKKYFDTRFASVATKDDLKAFATKDDVKVFATKDDLVALETRTDAKFDALTTTLKDIVTLVDKRFDAVDSRFEAVDARFDALEEHIAPITNQVSGHEKRLKFLEDRLPKLA